MLAWAGPQLHGGGGCLHVEFVSLCVTCSFFGLGGFLGEELIEMRGDVQVSANRASPFVRVTSLHSHPIHLQPTPQDRASPGD